MVDDAATGMIRLTVEGNMGRILIDNPSQRNALTRDMCLKFVQVILAAEADPCIKVITFRGQGSDFCAGAAINELERVLCDTAPDGELIDRLSEVDVALRGVRKPTIALVEGVCMGGGWQLASACDMSIPADTVKLAITPAKLGVLYPRFGIERLVQRLGVDRAKYVLFSADLIPAAKAGAWGLFTEIVPEADFEEFAQGLVGRIAERSQYSIHTMKMLIDSMAATQAGQSDKWWGTEWVQLPKSGSTDSSVGHSRPGSTGF